MDIDEIITEIAAYAKATGLSASTVCVRATGNSRLMERLERRRNQTEEDAKRITAFMADNPPSKEGTAQ